MASKNIQGINIELGGDTTGLTDAIKGVEREATKLQSELREIDKGLKLDPGNMDLLAQKSVVLAKEIAAVSEKLNILKNSQEQVNAQFAAGQITEEQYRAFGREIVKTSGFLNKLSSDLDDTNDRLENGGKSSAEMADELKKAGQNVDSFGKNVDESGKNADELGDKLDDAGKHASTFGDVLKASLSADAIKAGISGIVNAVSGIASAIGNAAMAAGKAFAGMMKEGVEYNAQMESYTASFTTMLGDQAAAQQLVNNLKKEAAATPFGMKDLASATQMMMSFGMSAEESQKHLKELGDISQGDAEKFKSLTLAFSQASSTGKLMGQDLNQMINAGFNPLEEMARTTGKSIAELKDEMSKGGISAQMLADALASATSEGGRFYGAMEAQSKTFTGQMATLEDNVASLKGQLAEGLTGMLSETVMPMVNGWLGQLSDAFEQGGAQGLIDALGSVIAEAAAYLAENAPGWIEAAAGMINSLASGISAALPVVAELAVTIVEAIANGLLTALPGLLEMGTGIMQAIAGALIAALPVIAEIGANIIGSIGDTIIGSLPLIAETAMQLIQALADGLVSALPQLTDVAVNIMLNLVEMILANLPKILDAGVKAVITLADGIAKALPELIPAIV